MMVDVAVPCIASYQIILSDKRKVVDESSYVTEKSPTKILRIFLTGGAYAPCMSTPQSQPISIATAFNICLSFTFFSTLSLATLLGLPGRKV